MQEHLRAIGPAANLEQAPERIIAQPGLERARIAQRVAVGVGLNALFNEAVLYVIEIDAVAIGGEIAT